MPQFGSTITSTTKKLSGKNVIHDQTRLAAEEQAVVSIKPVPDPHAARHAVHLLIPVL